jgi:hypothetical protein
VSTGANGEANRTSLLPVASRTGRFVAFESRATNLVTGDTNGVTDVFLRDTQLNTTTLVSRASNGALGNGASTKPDLSADGRYLMFTSAATNLVANDDNNATDVFIRDLRTGTTRLVSKATDGTVAHGSSTGAALSADGTKAVFQSDADDIVAGASGPQVYLADLTANTIRKVSSPGLCPYNFGHFIEGISATADASRVAYAIECHDGPIDTYPRSTILVVVRDVAARTNAVAWAFASQSAPFAGFSLESLSFAADGSRLVWMRVEQAGVHARLFTPYTWSAGLTATTLEIADQPTSLALSPDGARVAYSAPSPDYLSGLPHVRVKLFDIASTSIYEVSVPNDGPIDDEHPNGDSFAPRFSGDGLQIVWYSSASDLVPGDTNHASDIFERPVADVVGGSSGGMQRVSG